jgi:GTP cyclohydrolase I
MRITKAVAERLQKELNAKGVAVHLTAKHMCMCMRGVRKPQAQTVTTFFTGVFNTGPDLKSQFMATAQV